MEYRAIERITAVIAYVETHLQERLDLETVAAAAHYSKYHLHRMFTDTVGITLHGYIRRRQLTEAARLLVFSQRPIVEIAPVAGYESQQAFTCVFKTMYKKTPVKYRQEGRFYPLQLPFTLNSTPSASVEAGNIAVAGPEDIPAWMNFVPLVIDGFPCFNEAEHLARLKGYIAAGEALLMRDGGTVAAAAACSRQTGSIDFLGVHPQYRRYGAGEMILNHIAARILTNREISITTFRQGDRADTGQRAAYRRLGFTGAELLMEFGYPTQRLILRPGREEAPNG